MSSLSVADSRELLQKFNDGNVRALSRIISCIEDNAEGYQEILGQLHQHSGKALRIGVTGPPGAGKSTLVNGLAKLFLGQHKRVGIIAVDPSSPFTGGALLGDRVRMQDLPSDGRVFFRSMATRGARGGLASATNNVGIALDAFGFDITLIETVGVGQIEIDVIDTCDVVVVALVPESGDSVQTLKAGLLEIANIMVVNKSDRPGADSLAAEMRQAIKLRQGNEDRWKIPVVPTQATHGGGLEKLVEKIDAFIDYQKQTGGFESHRHRRMRKMILAILSDRFRREFLDRLSDHVDFERIIEDITHGRTDPYRTADELFVKYGQPG
jgi:LAO/AO transport system kinase